MPRNRGRKDNNQRGIEKALGQIPGVTFHDTSGQGRGFPDLVVGYRGKTFLFEIKNEEWSIALTKDEKIWHNSWTGHVETVTNLNQILKAIGICQIRNSQSGGALGTQL